MGDAAIGRHRVDGSTTGRAKNSARSGHRLLTTAIRAGFEPGREALPCPRYRIVRNASSLCETRWANQTQRNGSKPARISYRANRAHGRAEFFALPIVGNRGVAISPLLRNAHRPTRTITPGPTARSPQTVATAAAPPAHLEPGVSIALGNSRMCHVLDGSCSAPPGKSFESGQNRLNAHCGQPATNIRSRKRIHRWTVVAPEAGAGLPFGTRTGCPEVRTGTSFRFAKT